MKGKRYPMPPGRYEQVMDRDKWCQANAYGHETSKPCDNRLVVHHRLVKGMGGTADPAVNDAENLVVVCETHHLELHSNAAKSYENGLLLRHTT